MAALYVVAAWLIMQVADVLIDLARLPEWTGPAVLVMLGVGFPIALTLSWFYELTSEGVIPEKDMSREGAATQIGGRRIDVIVIALLAAAALMFAWDKWWSVPPEQSIAVLPLVNLSGDREQDYFSDGISVELLNLIARVPGIRVTARSSSFRFKDSDKGVREIAGELGVAHLLEGTVRRSGDRIRVDAQLVKADDEFQVWSLSYDRDIDDIFAVQEEIASAVIDALGVRTRLGAGDAGLPAVAGRTNADAYDAYLRGRELINLRDMDNLEQAVDELRHALALDDHYAPAHAQMAIALLLQTYSADDLPVQHLENLEQLAAMHLQRAESLAPHLSEVHAARALRSHKEIDPEQVIVHANKALEANPSNTEVMVWQQLAYETLGEYRKALSVLEQLLDVDPLSTVGLINYASYLADRGNFAEAHKLADRVLALNPLLGRYYHSTIAFDEGDIAGTLRWGLQVPAPNPVLAELFLAIGEYDELRRFDVLMTQLIDLAEGRYEEAAVEARAILASEPDVYMKRSYAEITLYYAGYVDELRETLEAKLRYAVPGRPISGRETGLFWTMRLAMSRRLAGDEGGARELVRLVSADLAMRRASGEDSIAVRAMESQLAVFEGETDRALDLLATILRPGLVGSWAFNDPIYATISEEPRFIELRRQFDANVAATREEVLQIICFDNPAPETWQPLPETCEGVVQQR